MKPSLRRAKRCTERAPHSLSFIACRFYILFCLFLSYKGMRLDPLLFYFYLCFLFCFFKYLMSTETPTSSQFAYTLLHVS